MSKEKRNNEEMGVLNLSPQEFGKHLADMIGQAFIKAIQDFLAKEKKNKHS